MLELFEFRQNFLPFVLLGAAVVLLVFFGCSLRLKLRSYRIASAKIKDPIKLMVLSDLHSCCFGKEQEKLLRLVEEAQPDVVLFPGDTVDDRLPPEPAFLLLEKLAQSYPCLLVTGNHEYRTMEMDALKHRLTGLGVTVLENRSVADEQLAVHGLEDPEGLGEEFGRRLQMLGENVDPKRFNLLLTHRPERFEEYIPYGFDLVVCGHTHGGQWRLPGLVEGLFATGQGLFPTYVGGSYEKDGCNMIVSRGLSKKHLWIPRIFNPPEAVLITLLPKE